MLALRGLSPRMKRGGAGEMAQHLKALAALKEKFPANRLGGWPPLATVSSWGSGALFWSPGTPEQHVTYIHTNTHAYMLERGVGIPPFLYFMMSFILAQVKVAGRKDQWEVGLI